METCDFRGVWDAQKHQLALLELLRHPRPHHLPLLKLIEVVTTEGWKQTFFVQVQVVSQQFSPFLDPCPGVTRGHRKHIRSAFRGIGFQAAVVRLEFCAATFITYIVVFTPSSVTYPAKITA